MINIRLRNIIKQQAIKLHISINQYFFLKSQFKVTPAGGYFELKFLNTQISLCIGYRSTIVRLSITLELTDLFYKR